MNKKIKIIDLLNKIANGEEVPKIIRAYYGNVHDDYKYDEILKWYITLDDTTVLNAIDKLNMEVEILEDNTEEIEETTSFEQIGYDVGKITIEIAKGLEKAINELRKEKE